MIYKMSNQPMAHNKTIATVAPHCFLLLLLFLLPLIAQCAPDRRTTTRPTTTTTTITTTTTNYHHDKNPLPKSNLDPSTGGDDSAASYDSANSDGADQGPDGGGAGDKGDSSKDSSELYQAPIELEVIRLNDTSVVLKWTMPDEQIAHEHLQFFKIQHQSTRKNSDWKTENREIPPTTKAYQINNLRPGNYFFVVIAVYDNDDNASSEKIKYRLRARSKINSHDMPEQKAPQIHWYEVQSDYLRFKWNYGFKDKDMQYYGYLVYYRSAHLVTDFTIYVTLDENVEIAELEPETPYEVKVVAYNQFGVSDFSDTVRVKTKAKSNSTTSTPPNGAITTSKPYTPTTMPATTDKSSDSEEATNFQTTTISPPPSTSPTTTTGSNTAYSSSAPAKQPATSGPTVGSTTPPSIIIINNSNSTVITNHHQVLSSMIDLIMGDRSDPSQQMIRYVLLALILVIFIVSISICLISCRQRPRKSPSSSTHEPMHFGLEIDGLFTNSFPVVEKEYPTKVGHLENHGFINNHPHINDFAN